MNISIASTQKATMVDQKGERPLQIIVQYSQSSFIKKKWTNVKKNIQHFVTCLQYMHNTDIIFTFQNKETIEKKRYRF